MKIQLLSDLHLETESFEPQPSPQADCLVLAGDIDSTWAGLQRFAGWPVPVLMVPGNHEYDGRDVDAVLPALRETCDRFGIRLLHRESTNLRAADGSEVRFIGVTRWSDFDVFGAARRERAMRAAAYFMRTMGATRAGQPFEAEHVRTEGLACRAWLEQALTRPALAGQRTVVVTHFAPSLRSADPRYGLQNGTASFCNADDDLIPRADLWLHGHLHCRHDYLIARAGRRSARVVCQARGLAHKGEDEGFDPLRVFEV
jgi:Calcineurin-like phosphoesterase